MGIHDSGAETQGRQLPKALLILLRRKTMATHIAASGRIVPNGCVPGRSIGSGVAADASQAKAFGCILIKGSLIVITGKAVSGFPRGSTSILEAGNKKVLQRHFLILEVLTWKLLRNHSNSVGTKGKAP
jgi:hypothetical protein